MVVLGIAQQLEPQKNMVELHAGVLFPSCYEQVLEECRRIQTALMDKELDCLQ